MRMEQELDEHDERNDSFPFTPLGSKNYPRYSQTRTGLLMFMVLMATCVRERENFEPDGKVESERELV